MREIGVAASKEGSLDGGAFWGGGGHAYFQTFFHFAPYPGAVAPTPPHPLDLLSPPERDLVLALARAGGSLKAVAARYQVSYPTLRARMDALIGRIAEIEAGRSPDPMAEHLARLLEEGQISASAAKATLKLHREMHA